jgi:hypothetical protein
MPSGGIDQRDCEGLAVTLIGRNDRPKCAPHQCGAEGAESVLRCWFRFLGTLLCELCPDFATQDVGFLRVSGWRVNRASSQGSERTGWERAIFGPRSGCASASRDAKSAENLRLRAMPVGSERFRGVLRWRGEGNWERKVALHFPRWIYPTGNSACVREDRSRQHLSDIFHGATTTGWLMQFCVVCDLLTTHPIAPPVRKFGVWG